MRRFVFRWIVQVVEPRQIKRKGKIHRMSTRQFSNTSFSEVLQCGGRERPGSLIILSSFPRLGRPPRVSSLQSCHIPGPGAAMDAMPALIHPAEISTLLGTGGRTLPVVDRVVGPACNGVNGAGVQAALGHRSLKSIRCKRGRGTIVDHQTKRFIGDLRNTEV